jgi:hypothetical protein
MVLELPTEISQMRMDKRALRQAVTELNRQIGFVKDPTATAEKSRELLLASGIRPEDNIASCEIIRIRSDRE